ncbi:hypothetical protein M8C21_007086 [Ambrosia artemisiifolia]|uniref:NET domain-containing protein n=1 Tax=Ambrosia artemisiifolia TaxID=4212 RepID=A0AAD5C4U0_AMBAR|nr:hypothetical protein M8C21_007086 [Ambrosia artemisiifolia]
MSEVSRDMNTSNDEMDIKMDLFQYYIHGIRELMSRDDFTPSEKEETGRNDKMFSNAVGNELSAHRKDRLVTLLRQSVVALYGEVDEMLDPVFSMLQLRRLLAPENNCASDQDANNKIEERERKRLKVNETVSSGNLTEEGSLSEKKRVVEVESVKHKSLTRCNTTGCGKYGPKSSFDESKSLCGDCSKHGMNESFWGSSSRNDKELGEVNDVLQVLLENRGPTVIEKMDEHSAELSATLKRMEEKLEELVDLVVSGCRAMSLEEKHQLRRLVENLDPENLDRVVQIIQRGKPPEKQARDDITVDLQNEDKSTLWRIYFHVKAVENARKLL